MGGDVGRNWEEQRKGETKGNQDILIEKKLFSIKGKKAIESHEI